jgi:hypothetical protein
VRAEQLCRVVNSVTVQGIVKRPIQGGSWKRDKGDRSEGKCKCRQRRQQSNQAGKAPPPSQGRCVVLDAGTVSAAKSQMEHQQAADLLSGLPTPTTVSVSSDSLRESILQISACFPIVFVCLYISLHSHVAARYIYMESEQLCVWQCDTM